MRTGILALLLTTMVLGSVALSSASADENSYNYFSISVQVPHEHNFLLNRSAIHERLADAGIEVLRVDNYNSALITRSTQRQPSSSSVARAFDGTEARLAGIQHIQRPESLDEQ